MFLLFKKAKTVNKILALIFSGVNLSYLLLLLSGVEARGFIFGPPIALAIGAKFVPIRKPKKLPGMFFQCLICSSCFY